MLSFFTYCRSKPGKFVLLVVVWIRVTSDLHPVRTQTDWRAWSYSGLCLGKISSWLFLSSNDSPVLIYSLWWLAVCRLIDSKPSSSYFHFCSLPSLLLQFIFPLIQSFSPLPLLCHWILFDRKYSRRCGAGVDLALWQTVSIGLICIHKSIGYLTLANTQGSRERRCWVDQVTLSLVMELWWSVTALHSCWLTAL